MTNTSPSPSAQLPEETHESLKRGFTAWPLWAVAAGIAGSIGTIATDLRPPAEQEAWKNGDDYTVTAADMASLDPTLGRVGFIAGLIAIIALLILYAAWRRHVERRFAESTAVYVVSAGFLATAAALLLGYGWRGALANYLGPEAGYYEADGLFIYYMLTDFGAYLPWFGVLVAAAALGWMAWMEHTVSRGLGTVSALMAIGLFAAVIITGVPGLPGALMPIWLAVAGVWLAVGRSRITEPEQV